MNKIFKIVFNAARGKMMVVNEATSSVQTGKKAAVTVAVIGALAAGVATAADVQYTVDDVVLTNETTLAAPVHEQHSSNYYRVGLNSFDDVKSSIDVSAKNFAGDSSGTRVFGVFLRDEGKKSEITSDLTITVTAENNSNVEDIRGFTQTGNAETVTTFKKNVTITTINNKGGAYQSGQFANALNIDKGSKVIFEGDLTTLSSTHMNGHASQAAITWGGAVAQFEGKDVVINATGEIGANGFGTATDGSDSAFHFNNSGNVVVNIAVTGEDVAKKSNAIGYFGTSGGNLIVTENVDKFEINISGSGSDSVNGTKGIFALGNVDIDSQIFAVNVFADKQEGQAKSYGIYAYGQNGIVDINSSQINVYVEDSQSSPIAVSAVEGAKITLTGNTVSLTGDVEVDNTSSLTLNGQTSLTGKATIDGTLAGNGQLLINTEDSAIKLSGDTNVTVGTTGELTDKLGGKVEEVAGNFEGVEEIVMQEGEVFGEVTATLGTDDQGNTIVIGKSEAINTKTEALADKVALAPEMITRIMMNDVRKRMGDLRAAEGTHGAWARYNGGQMSGSGVDADFHMVQVGIDTVPVVDAPRFGVAFSYAQTEAKDNLGTTDMDSFSLAFYGTKMYDNGMFVDVIGRMATMDSDIVNAGAKGKMDNVALSLSGELGWRFDVTDRFFFEPSVEATYTYTNADTFTMTNGGTYELEAVDSLVGRAGFAAGFKCPANKGDIYVRAAVVHEFMGDMTVNSSINGLTAASLEADGKDTWFEYAIGANFNVNKNTYVYADIERTEGAAMDEDWRANVGVRFAF